MSCKLADRHTELAKRSAAGGYGSGPRATGKSATYKRPSVSTPTTSAHSCGGRWSRRGALLKTGDVGASLGGELGRRSIITKEDKGVMET